MDLPSEPRLGPYGDYRDETGVHHFPSGTVSGFCRSFDDHSILTIHAELDCDPDDWALASAYLEMLWPGGHFEETVDLENGLILLEARIPYAVPVHSDACPAGCMHTNPYLIVRAA